MTEECRSTLLFLLCISTINGATVDILPESILINKGQNFDIACNNIEPSNWYSLSIISNCPIGDGSSDVTEGVAANNPSGNCVQTVSTTSRLGETSFSCNFTVFVFSVSRVLLGAHNCKLGCHVIVLDGSRSTKYADIEVKEPLIGPTIYPSEQQTIKVTTTRQFQCTSYSFPPAEIKWYINDRNVAAPSSSYFNGSTSSLTYTAIKSDIGKHLFCTALNKYESSNSSKVILNIIYRPIVSVYPSFNRYRVLENTKNIQLACIVRDANPAVTSFKWIKNYSTVSSEANYTIQTVKRLHAGNYTCRANNSMGDSDPSAAIQLDVLYGAEVLTVNKTELTEGTQLLITCDGQSNPTMTDNDVTWTKQNNNTFRMIGKQLLVRNINRVDSGNFMCTVMMELLPTVGSSLNVTTRTTVDVDVLYRPTVTIYPSYTMYTVIENTSNLELRCIVVDANPAATSYRWYTNGSLIDDTAASYTLPKVQRSQTGRYTCVAINNVGSSDLSAAVQLIVMYGVEIDSISKQEPAEMSQLLISCNVRSYPAVTNNDVIWTKQNNATFRSKGQQLVIRNVNKMDNGIFVCSVVITLTPTIGQPVNVTGSTNVEVHVLYRPDVAISPVQNPYKVIENTTNFHLTCTVTDANPAATSYRWYKDGVKVSTAATYFIPKVYRYHTGSYTCYALNTVGISDPSNVLQLNVLYGVSLILSRSEINIDESKKWEFSCIGDGNPLPNVACVYGYNGTTVGEQKHNTTSISVNHANCMDTGYYMCSGNNTIGEPVSQSAEIKVACKPRTYNNLDREDILMRATDESINISTIFISFPLSHISWSGELSDGQLADLDSNFKYFSIPSHLPYETIAILQKDQLKPNEFGIYLVNASNIYGSFLMKYHFIQKKDPIPPSYVYIVCKSTTAIVIFMKPIANENLPQDLYIQYHVEEKDMISIKVLENVANQPNEYTVTGLNPGRKYNFSILAVNPYGETRSNQFECLTETLSYCKDMLAVKLGNGDMFSAGIASLVVGLLFFVAATIFIFRKRFKKTYIKSSKSNDYADLQASNPAFQDPYTSIHNPIESRHHQESSANTYEECGNASDAAAYQNTENMKSGHKKEEKNLGIYDNMKI